MMLLFTRGDYNMVLEPAGNDIKLTTDNDILITDRGDIGLVYDNENLIQTAVNNMSTRYGELENDPTRGNKLYNSRVKFTDSGMRDVEVQCSDAILQDQRVSDILQISATYKDQFECYVSFTIVDVNKRIIDGSTAIILSGG